MPYAEIEQTGCYQENKDVYPQRLFRDQQHELRRPGPPWKFMTRGCFKFAAACRGMSDSSRRQSSGSMLLVLYVTKSMVARIPLGSTSR